MSEQDRGGGPGARPEDAAGIPLVDLHDPDNAAIPVLRSLQRMLLKHPVAAQALFAALVAEGRRFARTAEGKAMQSKLEHSPLVQQASHVLDMSTLSLLEENPVDFLPSNYLDVLFMLAGDPDSDRILSELFGAAGSSS
jgi:hypothetical protein